MILSVYVDEKTEARMKLYSQESGRSMEELADTAVSEAALDAFRHRRDDPAANIDQPKGEGNDPE